MSKDKHKGVARRKFALANAHKVFDSPRMSISSIKDPTTKTRNSMYPPRESVDITADLKRLEKQGKVKRVRKRVSQDGSRTRFKAI